MKTVVTSESLKLSGNTLLIIASTESLCKTLTVASKLDFSVFGAMFLCAVAFLRFRSLIPSSILLDDSGSNDQSFPSLTSLILAP